ncbi:MAG: hypothetical protein DRP71_11340 [Verrucomicrobia bacterium]|nr:MAG: hypothetical protein DRP71_11340 [Verrucomicrobiota bacterium]
MSAVDEEIVREYFEQNGFLVRQVRKYRVQSRKKTSDEEIDLLVYNPTYVKSGRKPDFFVFPSELPHIHRAMVAVKAWHTGKLNPATIRNSPDILRFLEEQVQKEAHRLFAVETLEQDPDDEMLKILVTPGLPTQEPYRSQSVSLLQDRGVDGIISFRSMLLDLLDRVEINRNYGKSDTLQVMRILKNYDLLTDSQMDLFPGKEAPASRRR